MSSFNVNFSSGITDGTASGASGDNVLAAGGLIFTITAAGNWTADFSNSRFNFTEDAAQGSGLFSIAVTTANGAIFDFSNYQVHIDASPLVVHSNGPNTGDWADRIDIGKTGWYDSDISGSGSGADYYLAVFPSPPPLLRSFPLIIADSNFVDQTYSARVSLWIDDITVDYVFAPIVSGFDASDAKIYNPGTSGTIVMDTGTLATVTDQDNSAWTGGNVKMRITNRVSGEDSLGLRNEGSGAGQVGVSGSNVTYGGVTVGTLSGGGSATATITVTLNASATNAAVAAIIHNFTYSNSAGAPTGSRTLTVTATDGDGAIGPGAATTVTFNTPPTLNHNAALGVIEGGSGTITATQLDYDDAQQADSAITYTVTSGVTNGTLFKNGVQLNNGGTFTQADIGNNLITYTHNGTETTSAAFGFSVSDGLAAAITGQTFNFTVAPVNDAPVATASGGTKAATEQTPVAIDTGITISDSDSVNLSSATVSITNNFQTAEDVLGFVNANGITGSYNAGTGVLTLTGSSSVANYQAALRSVTYNNTSDTPNTATRTVSFKANDGSLDSATTTKLVSVAAANDAPVSTASGGTTAAAEQLAIAVDTGVTVSDVDSATLSSATVSITGGFQTGQDVLSFASQNGITGSYNAGTGVLTLTGSSSVANYQTALRSVTYTNSSDAPNTASRTVSFKVNDGSADSNTTTKTVSVAAVNDAPVATASGGTTAATEQSAVAIDTGLTVSDPDSANLSSATVSITGGFQTAEDVLTFATQNGITGSYNAGTGVLTLTGSSSVANYQTALRSITYTNSSDAPNTASRTVSFKVNDGSTDGNTTTKTVSVVGANDAPVATASGGTTAATEQVAVAIDTGVTVSDIDSANLSSATVSITGGFQTAEDVLTFATQNGITGSYNAGTGVLTLTGSSSVANYQAALRSVTYTNSSDTPNTASRTVSFKVNDGGLDSNVTTKSVSVAAANDAPVATASGGTTAATEQVAVAIDTGLSVSDIDSANLSSATVSITGGFQAAEDILTFATQSGITGSYNAGTGVLTLTGSSSVANYQTALRSVTYTNSSDAPTTANRTMSFKVNDGSTDGNTTTKTVSVVGANDAPVATASGGTTAATEQVAVAIDGGVTVSDIDSANLTGATVSITGGFQTGQDVLAFANANGITGSYNAGTGVLTLTGSSSVANYQTALRSVTYTNSSDAPNTANRTVSFKVNDGGGDSNTTTKTVSVAGSNDAPTATASGGTTAATEQVAVAIDAGLTLADADSANLTGAVVAVTGHFVVEDTLGFTTQNGITGSYNAGTGVLTLTGTATVAQYQAALRSVTYTNDANAPDTTSRTVSFTVNDGSANSNTTTKTVSIANVNDAPVATASAGTTAALEQVAVAVDAGIVAFDVDGGDNLTSATVSITGGFQSGQDVLSFASQNGITGSYNAGTGVLTLTGATTPANYQTALRSVTYTNSSDTPNTANRTISFKVHDNAVDSSVTTKTVSVTGVNDAPSGTDKTINVGSLAPRTLTAADFGFSDTDGNTLAGVKIVALPSSGQLVHVTALPPGVPLAAGDVIDLADLNLGKYKYIPSTVTSGPTSFTFQVQDNGGTANGGVNLDPTPNLFTLKVGVQPLVDFNGDRFSDLVFQNTDGSVAAWTMNGASILNSAYLGNAGPDWHVRTGADMDGDGNADLLWQKDNGDVVVWTMNGTTVSSTKYAATAPAVWHIKDTGDFDGNGKADILWQHDNGTVALWTMNGGTIIGLWTVAAPGADTHAVAAADFNSDGLADIVLQKDDGTILVWTMDGAGGVVSTTTIANPGATWHVKDAFDFNTDGQADLLLQNDNGSVALWTMNNLVATSALLGNPGATWHVKEAGDFNHDGLGDISLQNDNGNVAIWSTNGSNAATGALVLNPGVDWHLI